MTDEEIKCRLIEALNIFLKNEQWLLIHDLSEQSMCHKLAEYLQHLFAAYNVDCEYNGDIERDNGRKQIDLLKVRLQERGLLRQHEVDQLDELQEEYVIRAVFPDIIVHHRGTNKDNLLIIEVKKSHSAVPRERYDNLKLEAFTSNENGNDLHYQLGAFVKFITNERRVGYEVKYYQEGLEQIGN